MAAKLALKPRIDKLGLILSVVIIVSYSIALIGSIIAFPKYPAYLTIFLVMGSIAILALLFHQSTRHKQMQKQNQG